ncbi:MAG TPA: Ig-like domain-containing protein [Acidimicrobiales bacterium]|nr:Ig-like domain-containing protein [Acidimicrobiales bacterium]
MGGVVAPRRGRTSVVAVLVLVASMMTVAPRPSVADTVSPDSGPGISGGALVTQVGDLEIAFFPCPADPSKRGDYQTYKVPPGTTSLYVEAVGGQGETPDRNETGWGGLGSQVTASLPVKPGELLKMGAGCGGTSAGGVSPYANGGGRGLGRDKTTYFIRSYGIDGGGGGGASAVLDAQGAPLVVAGGGGGSAGGATACYGIAFVPPPPPPGRAGVAPRPSNVGPATNYYTVCIPPLYVPGADGGVGGKPAGAGAVGQGNPSPAAQGGCSAGRAGQRGHDFDQLGAGGAGGGGGGGYRGGCGGSAAPRTPGIPIFSAAVTGIAGNGGGGGESFVHPKAYAPSFKAADNAGDGYVLVLSGADSARTFTDHYTRRVVSHCIPAGTDRIFVDATGGAGADGESSQDGAGGGAGRVQAVVGTSPGTQTIVQVGEFGRGNGGWGGHDFDGGEGHGEAGSGGAASVVQMTSARCGAPTPRIDPSSRHQVVAGGGGGGGEGGAFSTQGGDGGHGGQPPGHGGHGGSEGGGCSGGDGGRGGANDTNRGGEGTTSSTGGDGGGGGGGLRGGGKGHGESDGESCAGGGGGGGRSAVIGPVFPPVVHTHGPGGEQGGDGSVTLLVPFPSKRDEVAVVSGSKQQAFPGSDYSEALVAQALDDFGLPIPNRVITFSAPDGYVTFANGSTTRTTVTTDGAGKASVAVRALSPPVNTGDFQVTASAATGSDGRPIKAAGFALYNKRLPTSLMLTSSTSANRTNPGQPVEFTATVKTAPLDPYNPDSGHASVFGVPSGPVRFSVDGQVVTTASLANGTGRFRVPSLSPGLHVVEAAYLGDGRIFGPTSSSLAQASALDPVTLGLSSSNPAATTGTPIRFTATVKAPAGVTNVPTGAVQFSVDGIQRGNPVRVASNGSAMSAPVVDLTAGLHTVVAYYLGDSNFLEQVTSLPQHIQAGRIQPVPTRPDRCGTLHRWSTRCPFS